MGEAAPVQFRLRTLFAAVTLVAISLAVARQIGPGVLVPVVVLLICLWGWPTERSRWRPFVYGAVVLQIASIAEMWVGLSIYHTHGAEGTALLGGMVLATVYLATEHGAARAYRTSIVAGVLLVIAIAYLVPRQVVLTKRLEHLRHETARIVAYLEQRRAATGSYPADLSDYRFEWPELAEYVKYWPGTSPGPYFLEYHPIKDAGIQHWYCPAEGWGYYDD